MSSEVVFPVAGIAPVKVRNGKVYWAGDGVWNPHAGESTAGLRDALLAAEEVALSQGGEAA